VPPREPPIEHGGVDLAQCLEQFGHASVGNPGHHRPSLRLVVVAPRQRDAVQTLAWQALLGDDGLGERLGQHGGAAVPHGTACLFFVRREHVHVAPRCGGPRRPLMPTAGLRIAFKDFNSRPDAYPEADRCPSPPQSPTPSSWNRHEPRC
jgi:hypothetical protein